MAIKSFSEYVEDDNPFETASWNEPILNKQLEFLDDGFEVLVKINLTRQEQHPEVIRFLRRVANELEALNNAFQKNRHKYR
jgi:hypothetical protein